jgi:hypothetical protein
VALRPAPRQCPEHGEAEQREGTRLWSVRGLRGKGERPVATSAKREPIIRLMTKRSKKKSPEAACWLSKRSI